MRTLERLMTLNRMRNAGLDWGLTGEYSIERLNACCDLLEQERIEAEKERIRAERRAANPDGITANTSKKKLEKQQRDQEQAAKAAAAKEYAARKGIVEEAAREENAPLSGVSDRPFCKGRNYDPDRYAPKSMEE